MWFHQPKMSIIPKGAKRLRKSLRVRGSYGVSSGLSTCKGPTGERKGMSEQSDEIPPQKSIGPNSGPDSTTLDSIES